MLKLNRILTCLSMSLLSASLMPIAAQANDLVAASDRMNNQSGVCNLYNVSGYMIVDAMGRLVNLRDYCGTQPGLTATPQANVTTSTPRTQAAPQRISAAPQQLNNFWNQFVSVADPEAIAFARTLDRQDVIAYGSTICPFLQNGGSLEDLRQIQSDADLPAGFEAAITVAAINTYCPSYRASIGQ